MSWGNYEGQTLKGTKILRKVKNEKKGRLWECQCVCGNIFYKNTSDIRRGYLKCPDCTHNQYRLKGKRFGRLTVLEKSESEKRGTYWLCKCDCGRTKIIKGNSLVDGKTISCGCLSREKIIKNNTKHGMHKTRIYHIWSDMKSRCLSEKDNAYCYYGGRGITVCDEWKNENGFIAFKNWAYANGYSDDLSLDRIDVNGNYEPDNCRWVTQKIQSNNRRDTIYLTMDNETHALTIWAEKINVRRGVLYWRKTHGWSDEKTLTTPVLNERREK